MQYALAMMSILLILTSPVIVALVITFKEIRDRDKKWICPKCRKPRSEIDVLIAAR